MEIGTNKTAHRNPTAILLHKGTGNPQPETCAFFSFGRKEWLEQMCTTIPWNSGSVVDDSDRHTAALRPNAYPQSAAFGERINGVVHKIGEDLSQFSRLHEDRQTIAVAFLKSDFLSANLWFV